MDFSCITTFTILLFWVVFARAQNLNATNDTSKDLVTTSQHSPLESRIVGGFNARDGQFPYQIELRVNGQPICGGAIISELYVVTAGHCVITDEEWPYRPVPSCNVTIRAGSIWADADGEIVGVSSVRVHPLFQNYNNDIAVLKLTSPLQFNCRIQPIVLAGQAPPSGAQVVTSGWGRLRNAGPFSPLLQFNVLTALSNAECRQQLESVPSSVLCLGHAPGNGVCNGDSGGPAVYDNRLVGVTNFIVAGCATSNPDGYANVATHVNWILNNLMY